MREIRSFLNDDITSQLELALVGKGLSATTARQSIETAAKEIDEWLTGLSATSLLNIRMYFFQKLSELHPDLSLREDSRITDILLLDTGIRAVGDTFERPQTRGGVDHWTVLWRKVGDRFGIEMAMKNQDGEIMHGEFFD